MLDLSALQSDNQAKERYMYTVFEVQINGELDPAKMDAYSRAVQMTATERHEGDTEVCLFFSSRPDELKELFDTDHSVIGYHEVGSADEYGRIARG
jgi:hypothetical protein